MKVFIAIALISAVILFSACYSKQSESVESDVQLLIDVTQFSKITSDQLIEIMGEPKDIEQWDDMIAPNRTYNITTYGYQVDGVDFEFNFINGMLIYMIAESPSADGLNVGINNDVFQRFGIVPKRNNLTGKSGPLFARWTVLNDDIAGVWVQGKDEIANWIKITYDIQYEMSKQ